MIIGSAPKTKKPAIGSDAGLLESQNLKESLARTGSVGALKIGKKDEAKQVPD
jgi:hypothetical protein